MNILILGSGGREHSLAWAVMQNPKCDKLIVAPGNAGIAQIAECAALDIENGSEVSEFCLANVICAAAGAPTAAYCHFRDAASAKAYVRSQSTPIVIKADGLAAGKGVIIAEPLPEAEAAIDDMFGGAFGGAGAEVVIEEFMTGEEASFFVLCDGEIALPIGTAQDHKRVGEGDTGPNTGVIL